ncbi:MAG: hypothetical protein MI723_06785 [Caulobacterales bacterium]|nr:hypothetical protein [Caulobacterales bacterium]
MSPQAMEALWMAGCAGVMATFGLIALVGYVRMKTGAGSAKAGDASR